MAIASGSATRGFGQIDRIDLGGKGSFVSSVDLADRSSYKVVNADTINGVTTKTLDVTLPRNGLVTVFEVVIRAARADQVAAGQAAQIRTSARTGGRTAVLDFGTPRTVAAIFLPDGMRADAVYPWIGTGFDTRTDLAAGVTNRQLIRLPSEVRTERLQLNVQGAADADRLATDLLLVLPDAPAGLELRIDNGAPVFTNPAPVQPSTSAELTDTGWNQNSERTVSLTSALAKLVGDPTQSGDVKFTLTLISKVPGDLDVRLLPSRQEVRFIRRASFQGAAEKELAFPAEGQAVVTLEGVPPNLHVQEVRMQASAGVPATRTLPAVGPEAVDAASPLAAEITVTPDRALLFRLDPATPLAQVSALRAPLRTGSSGAEVRMALWSNKPDAVQPGDLLPLPPSEPVTLNAAGAEAWVTFPWRQPVTLPLEGLWAALLVSRGEAAFRPASGSAAGSTVLLWGAPQGPWRDLPGVVAALRGRIHLSGTPKTASTVAPYTVALGAQVQAFTPNPKGIPVVCAAPAPVAQNGPAQIVVTSFVAANLTLRQVDIVSTD